MTDLKSQIEDFGRRARAAARVLARSSAEQKNRALLAMADELVAAAPAILEANAKDVAKAAADAPFKSLSNRTFSPFARMSHSSCVPVTA